MRYLYFYRKRVITIFLIFIIIGILIFGIFALRDLPRKQMIESKTNEASEAINLTEEKGVTSHNEIENKDFVTGKNILSKYFEVKNTDCAILVATTKYLETDTDLMIDEAEYPYIKYVIDEDRQNIAETILDSNGIEVVLSFVNYNAVLKDSCIFHKEGSNIYVTPHGFMEEDIIVERLDEADSMTNITYKAVFPLDNSEDSINHIESDSLYREAVLVDINSKVIGSVYIEQGEDSIGEEQK